MNALVSSGWSRRGGSRVPAFRQGVGCRRNALARAYFYVAQKTRARVPNCVGILPRKRWERGNRQGEQQRAQCKAHWRRYKES